MTGAIIVAAGYGSFREEAGRPIPKVIEKVRGVPMIVRALRAAQSVTREIVVVVNPRDQDLVHGALSQGIRDHGITTLPRVILQPDRFGSADAVFRAIPSLLERGERRTLVTYGDMPLWSGHTMGLVAESAEENNATVSMVTVPRWDQYPVLDRYGRVVRDVHGRIVRIVEVSDPSITADERAIVRVNPSLWVWDLMWLRENIPRIVPFKKTDGHPDERYMPPLIAMAAAQGRTVFEVKLTIAGCSEACGVNTLEELHAM